MPNAHLLDILWTTILILYNTALLLQFLQLH